MPRQDQTLSFLRRRFEEVGIRPRTRLGQNFLIDLNLLRVLTEAAALSPNDVVLEVGTGTGSLTALMAPQVAAVVTVEVDSQLFQLAAEELGEFSNVTQLATDALAGKNRIAPAVLEAVSKALAASPQRQWKLAANLPYQIATPLITNLLALPRPPVRMVVTIQREVADRILAAPGSKDYGSLSVWVQSQCRVELVRTLPPTVFWPRPKVTSAILRIDLDPELRGRIPNRDFFHRFLRGLFLHRRKFLRSQVRAAGGHELEKASVDRLLSELGLPADARAEQLTPETLLALAERVGRLLPDAN